MKNADQPAMPGHEYGADGNLAKGLSKREYFSGLAMQGILSDLTASEAVGYSVERKDVARQSVEMADALLAELERTS